MRAFITGASSGIGEGLALHYASAGATIGLCARRAPLLGELGRALEAKGARAIVYAADVADTAEMGRAAEAFVAAAGGVDLVIANAGIGIANEILAGKAEPIARLLRVNIIGVTNTIVPFVPIMLKQGAGTLAAVSSLAGFRGLPGRAAYSASKAAVITFMDALRLDLHGSGVHAMSLCPGFVHTPMTERLSGRMPFAISRDEAVRQMTRAIARRAHTFAFPWQARALSHVFTVAPEALVRRLAPAARNVGSD
ncbi:MAG TPA: SDR family NAD(P)-dependent oxidoreductase [Polyangia bacterium]|nr:SDR family NAD(P)-dependent oxidoreductase [Polyangia bacterium]